MMEQFPGYENISEKLRLAEEKLAEVSYQLEESRDVIDALRTGKVDAILVEGENGHQVFTLKNADQTYRIFIEKMTEGAVTLNAEGLILYSNSSFSALVGVPLEKIIGTSLKDYVALSGVEVYEKLLESAWQTDTNGELSLVNRAGLTIPFRLSFAMLHLDEGLCMSIILTDLTLLYRNQQLLKEQNHELALAKDLIERANNELEETVRQRTRELLVSREHFKFLGDHLPVIVWTALADGHIEYYNKKFYRYTGLAAHGKNGSLQYIVHPDDEAGYASAWQESLIGGIPFEYEFRLQAADGHYTWFLGQAVPYSNDDKVIQAWFGTCTDIDDQKRALEKKDEFITIASHELKTPLTGLKGYLQLIGTYHQEALSPTTKKFVGKATESLNKLQILVDDLLNVSKIQAGKLEFNVEEVKTSDLVGLCVDNARLIYPEWEIIAEYEEDCHVIGNIHQLEQVLMNLINNAVKYSPKSKSIVIKACRLGDHAQISVRDSGIGLSEDQKKLIFERFYRVENNKNFTSGLGMGLYISSNIIQRHKGQMGVESTLNEGSTFWFTVPVDC